MPRGLCGRCLIALGLNCEAREAPAEYAQAGIEPNSALSPESLGRLGDYELLDEIARGGMGVVYRARQKSVGRTVALKMILASQFVDEKIIKRFHGEVTSAALLRHPNIVTVHEVGMYAGQSFFSMDYVEGQNLAQLVGNRPLGARQAARYVKILAEAVAYAHSEGILHRDLKPSNVLIDSATDQPRLTDFGLAKRLDADSSLTVTGQVLGSPQYMPPEQASPGHGKVGRQSDVYGLGAILYHLLTARAPFQAESLPALVAAVVNTEPVAPRLLNPGVPRDLETICLKCLEKEPNRRYGTATDLADDLSRFLADEPVRARPIGSTGRFWRWCRRKPELAMLTGLALILFLVVLTGAPVAVLRISAARTETERNLYAADMRLASQALREGTLSHVKELLRRHLPRPSSVDLREFEWRYLWHASDQTGLVTHQFDGLGAGTLFNQPDLYFAGGVLYNIEGYGRSLLAWDIATWTPLFLKAPAQPPAATWRWYPGRRAALSVNDEEHMIVVFRLPQFDQAADLRVAGHIGATAITDEARRLAVVAIQGDLCRVLVWDLASGSQREAFSRSGRRVINLELSDTGILLARWDDGQIGLWSTASGEALLSPKWESPESVDESLAPPFFAPNSTRVFIQRGDDPYALQVWDWTQGKLSVLHRSESGGPGAWTFSPDGRLLAVYWDDLTLFDVQESRHIGTLRGHAAPVGRLAFSPSGALLATASQDHTARLWDVKTQRELQTLGGNDQKVDDVRFAPDEKSIVTINGEGKIKIWDLQALLRRGVLFHPKASSTTVLSPDQRAVAQYEPGRLSLLELVTGREISRFRMGQPVDGGCDIAFSPTAHALVWANRRSFGIANCDTGEMKPFPIGGNTWGGALCVAPNGRNVAFATRTNLMLCDIASAAPYPLTACDREVFSLAFSPDGSRLAGASDGGSVGLWNVPSGRLLATMANAHPYAALALSFSADGRLLATGGVDGTGKIWTFEPSGPKLRQVLRGHVGWVTTLCFSRDRRRIVSGGTDATLKMWDPETGLELATFYGHRTGVRGIWFSHDGDTIYSADIDGEVRSWSAPPLPALRAVLSERSQ